MSNWKPNQGGNNGKNFKKKNHFSLSNGPVVARILPQPKHGNTDYSPVWSVFHSVHFGYKNTEGKYRMFESPLVKNNKTKTVEAPDAALDRLNDLKDKLEKARADGNGPVMSKLNTLVGLKGVYSLDSNHHINVMLLDGSIGELKIRHKMKLDLDRELGELATQGVDPFSFEDGRFFTFSKSNTGRDTTFKVSVYKEKMDVPSVGKVEKEVSSKVSASDLARLETEGFDLTTLFNKVTSEEVAQIVSESDLLSGKSPACDRIFDARWKAQKAAANGTKSTHNTAATATASAVLTSAPVVPNTIHTASLNVAGNATLTAGVTAHKTQAETIEEMSDDEFYKSLQMDNTA